MPIYSIPFTFQDSRRVELWWSDQQLFRVWCVFFRSQVEAPRKQHLNLLKLWSNELLITRMKQTITFFHDSDNDSFGKSLHFVYIAAWIKGITRIENQICTFTNSVSGAAIWEIIRTGNSEIWKPLWKASTIKMWVYLTTQKMGFWFVCCCRRRHRRRVVLYRVLLFNAKEKKTLF